MVVTRGALPAVLAHFEGPNLIVKTFPVIEISEKDIEDTNGAGDAFTGGFLAEIALGHSMEVAMQRAMECSHQILKRKGF